MPVVLRLLAGLLVCGSTAGARAQGTFVESATLTHDGLLRYFDYYRPGGLSSDPVPLLFVLHGGTGSNDSLHSGTMGEFRELADQAGYVVVYPNGTSADTGLSGATGRFNWNDCRNDEGPGQTTADDVGFVGALIDWAEAQTSFELDADRVYSTGASNGGMMSYRLAFELSDRLAAIAAMIANQPANSECPAQPGRPVPVLIMNGTADTNFMPWGGGQINGNRGLVLSAHATRDLWIGFLETDPVPSHVVLPDLDPLDEGVVGVDTYAGGTQDSELVFYTVNAAGHNIPSIQHILGPLGESILGNQNHDIEAAVEIWSFLSQHRRPTAVPVPVFPTASRESISSILGPKTESTETPPW